MISVTDSAATHLRALLEEKGADAGSGLRLFVEKGGCAGWQYGMSIDVVHEGDATVERDGMKFFVDVESGEKLRGSVIDYCDDLTGTGFRIQNPNAARSCGCGTSFETAEAAAAS